MRVTVTRGWNTTERKICKPRERDSLDRSMNSTRPEYDWVLVLYGEWLILKDVFLFRIKATLKIVLFDVAF